MRIIEVISNAKELFRFFISAESVIENISEK